MPPRASEPGRLSAILWAGWPAGRRAAAIDAFVALNIAVLALDVYLAHSINAFARPVGWTPVIFSLIAPALLVAAIVSGLRGRRAVDRALGHAVGWAAVAVGVAGMVLHLDSRFFEEMTLRALVYSAPFAAPLAYAGLGLLLVMNRMVDDRTEEWSRWVIFLALAGFFGNFGLALADHAQNGFFHATEWVPVVAAAVAVGFLCVTVLARPQRLLLDITLAVLAAQVVVGLAGEYFHIRAAWTAEAQGLMNRIIYGAPVFAPMLFPNLALLAAAGVLDLRLKAAAEKATPPQRGPTV